MKIVSPLPGTFYRKPAPEKPDYKKQGDTVKAGEVIGLVEVMKNFIEVKAEVDGTFASYLIDNEAPVTAGQDIAEVNG